MNLLRSALLPIALGSVLSGCLSFNTFDTARALPAETMTHTIGTSVFVIPNDDDDFIPAPLPSYKLRYGVTDDWELGVLAGASGSFRLSLKYNPLRSEYFDLAVSPSGFVSAFPTDESDAGEASMWFIGADLPVLLGIRLGSRVTIIPWAGPGYVQQVSGSGEGWLVRSGLGVQFRISSFLTLHPEVTAVYDPVRNDFVDYVVGLGLGMGNH